MSLGMEKRTKKTRRRYREAPEPACGFWGVLFQKGFYIIDRLVHASIARGIINIILYVFLSKLIVVYTIFL